MADTTNSNMVIHDRLAQTAYFERLQDNLAVFNEGSGGALIIRSELIQGDFDKSAFYTIPGGMGHRDVEDTNDVTPKAIGSSEMVGVKSPWLYGPYSTTEEAFKRRARSPEEFSELLGIHMADAMIDYAIQAAFASIDAAIEGNAANMSVAASFATDHKKVVTKGLRTFGDRFGRISLLAMDSGSYFDMVDDAIGEKVYEEAGTVIYGGMPGTLGKPVLVTDKAPANKIFALQPGAAEIVESQAPGMRSYDVNGKGNLMLGYQAEGAFNVDLMGYSYAGAANPNLATLGAAASWTKYATSDKMTAGARIVLS